MNDICVDLFSVSFDVDMNLTPRFMHLVDCIHECCIFLNSAINFDSPQHNFFLLFLQKILDIIRQEHALLHREFQFFSRPDVVCISKHDLRLAVMSFEEYFIEPINDLLELRYGINRDKAAIRDWLHSFYYFITELEDNINFFSPFEVTNDFFRDIYVRHIVAGCRDNEDDVWGAENYESKAKRAFKEIPAHLIQIVP